MGRGGGESAVVASAQMTSRAESATSAEQLRAATAADYERYVSFFPELSLPASLLLPFDAWLRDLAPSTYFLVASSEGHSSPSSDGSGSRGIKSDGDVLAYVYVETLRDTGFIRHLVVHPERRRQGFGTKVLRAVAAKLAAAGCREWRLNVFPSNTAAIRLYSHLGLSPAHSGTCLQIPWEMLVALSHQCRLPHCDQTQAAAPSLGCVRDSCAGGGGGWLSSMGYVERLSEEEAVIRGVGSWEGSGVLAECEGVRVEGIGAEEDEWVEREVGLPLGLLQRMRALEGTMLAKAVTITSAEGCGTMLRAQCRGVGRSEGNGSVGDSQCGCRWLVGEGMEAAGAKGMKAKVVGVACYQESYGGFKVFRALSTAPARQLMQWFDRRLPARSGPCTLLVEVSDEVVQWLQANDATTKYIVVQMAGPLPVP